MKTSNRSYAMAMLAGLAIIGAATAGVSIAESHQTAAAAEVPAAPAVPATTQPSSDSAATGAASPPPTSAAARSDAASPPSAGTVSAAVPPTTATGATAASSTGTPAPATRGSTTTRTPGTGAKSPAASSSAPATSSSAPATSSSAPARAAAHQFKDGQYSSTGTYNSPGGTQHLGVTITLAADTVTAAKLDLLGQAGVAHSYQTLFASGYSAQVVGKNIASIKLGAVAGSSLTGIGFNMALQQIESQAHA